MKFVLTLSNIFYKYSNKFLNNLSTQIQNLQNRDSNFN